MCCAAQKARQFSVHGIELQSKGKLAEAAEDIEMLFGYIHWRCF